MELHVKYQPKTLSDVVGQSVAVGQLKALLASKDWPRCYLFSGPSGTGKTTLARILRVHFGTSDHYFRDINAASSRGIDMVRQLEEDSKKGVGFGDSKFYLIDEAQQLTKDAQNGILKTLDVERENVYFTLCSTNPDQLLRTIRTRCTEITLTPVGIAPLKQLLQRVAKLEKVELADEVCQSVAERAQGSPRKALVLLHQVLRLGDDEDQLAALGQAEEAERVGRWLGQALMNPATRWHEVLDILKDVKDDPETLRRRVRAYAVGCMKNSMSKVHRAYLILCAFERHFYDGDVSDVYQACFEVVSEK